MTEKFSRHYLIPGWNQALIQKATVIVAGVGALGNEVCRILATSGVGQLIVCDPDVVELSNLSRCTLFQQADIGAGKTDTIKKALASLAPHTSVDSRVGKFTQTIGLGTIRQAALVISCVDSNSARIQLAGRCNLVRTPYIDGGTNPWGGEVRPFIQHTHACYACANLDKADDDLPASCSPRQPLSPMGASLAITAIIGAWMSTFALRHIQQLEIPDIILRIDGASGVCTPVAQRRNPVCPLHEAIDQEILRVPLTHNTTITELMSYLPDGAIPLLWEPVPVNTDHIFGTNGTGETGSPYSHDMLYNHHHKVLVHEMTLFPPGTRLSQMGIPPGEVIPCRINDQYHYIEIL